MDASELEMIVNGAPWVAGSDFISGANGDIIDDDAQTLRSAYNALAATAKALACVLGTSDPAALERAVWAAGVGLVYVATSRKWVSESGPTFSIPGYEDGNAWCEAQHFRTSFTMLLDGCCEWATYSTMGGSPWGFERKRHGDAAPGQHVAAWEAFNKAKEATDGN